MYQFSLKWYINNFKEVLGTGAESGLISDQDKLLDIIRNFTHPILQNVPVYI